MYYINKTGIRYLFSNHGVRVVAIAYATWATYIKVMKDTPALLNYDTKSFINEYFLEDVERYFEAIEALIKFYGLEYTMQSAAYNIGVTDLKEANSAYSYYMSRR